MLLAALSHALAAILHNIILGTSIVNQRAACARGGPFWAAERQTR